MYIKDFEIPILFLVFNRPKLTQIVFNQISKIKPKKLYIASDGPRHDYNEKEIINQVRGIATNITWDCDLVTLFRNQNLGCKNAISSAIDWFFENEDKGIILEDDCLPNNDFFYFCQNLLYKYENDLRIYMITGQNFQDGIKRGNESYYFSNYAHIWGWASWRRVWNTYDKNMSFWPKWSTSNDWKKRFPDILERIYWKRIFNKVHSNLIDTWDYQLMALLKKNGGLCITPNVNLVSNIGFGVDATHTRNKNDNNSNIPTFKMNKIKHPKSIKIDLDADYYEFKNHWVSSRKKYLFFMNSIFKFFKKFFI